MRVRPRPVRGGSCEVACNQVRCGREVVTAVGGAHTAWLRHDGADVVPVHQPLDPATACATSLPVHGMDAGTAVAPAAVLMDLPDRGQEAGIGFGPLTHRAIAPDVIAGRRDLEHGTHQPYRIGLAVVFDEAEVHIQIPAKIAIDPSKMSRSMRNRSFSWCRRAISEAWSRTSRRLHGRAPRRRCRLLPELVNPAPQHRVAQTEFLGNRPYRASTRQS